MTSAATRREDSGTRVRIASTSKKQQWVRTGCDLTVDAEAPANAVLDCLPAGRAWVVLSGRRGPTPLGDKAILVRNSRFVFRTRDGEPPSRACQPKRGRGRDVKAGINEEGPGFTSGAACVRGRGAGASRQPLPLGASAHSCAGRCRGS